MNPACTVPRFLLPGLSWKTGIPLRVAGASRASVLLLQHQQQGREKQGRQVWQASRRSFHTAGTNRLLESQRSITYSGYTTMAPRGVAHDLTLRRSFHASAARRRDHHFDTLKFVQRLQEEGFTEEQSAAMMKVLNDVIEER
jgi:hypothetical protein